MPSFQSLDASENHFVPLMDDELGYASGSFTDSSLRNVIFTKAHLNFLNHQLQHLEPIGK